MPVTFAQVKAILDQTMADWIQQNGQPDLLGKHQTAHFSWNTAAELLVSTAKGLPLIQPEVIAQIPARGVDANLVQALRVGALKPDGVHRFPRMPDGGPYRSQQEIDVITQWIDEGCQP